MQAPAPRWSRSDSSRNFRNFRNFSNFRSSDRWFDGCCGGCTTATVEAPVPARSELLELLELLELIHTAEVSLGKVKPIPDLLSNIIDMSNFILVN